MWYSCGNEEADSLLFMTAAELRPDADEMAEEAVITALEAAEGEIVTL